MPRIAAGRRRSAAFRIGRAGVSVARRGVTCGRSGRHLAEARRRRRARAAAGRIDLHTHTTASDGEMTVEAVAVRAFRPGADSDRRPQHHRLAASRPARLVRERDLELDVFLGIEVICTRERRSFEFHAIAPTLSRRSSWRFARNTARSGSGRASCSSPSLPRATTCSTRRPGGRLPTIFRSAAPSRRSSSATN